MGLISSCLQSKAPEGKEIIINKFTKESYSKDYVPSESVYEIEVDEELLNLIVAGNESIINLQALLRGFLVRKMIKERFQRTPEKSVSTKTRLTNSKLSTLLDLNTFRNSFKEIPPDKVPIYTTHAATETMCRLGPFLSQQTVKEKKLTKRGPVILENDEIYTGDWNSLNQRHGRGVQVWSDGSTYEGYWKSDVACGKGRMISGHGDVYDGDWKNDKPNGYGVFEAFQGSRYEGYWKDNKKHGDGIETWDDGSSYQGLFHNGFQHGHGKMQWGDGSYYEGQFYENNFQGFGTYCWKDNKKYVGEWKDSKMHGEGYFTWADGRSYKGHYVNDKKEGHGIFRWPDGRSYDGQWLKGKQHGQGIYTTKSWVKEAIWKNGKRLTAD